MGKMMNGQRNYETFIVSSIYITLFMFLQSEESKTLEGLSNGIKKQHDSCSVITSEVSPLRATSLLVACAIISFF